MPDAAIDMAERAIVDTIGVTLAADQEDTVRALTRAHRGRPPRGGPVCWPRAV